jgi:hypothetical protein
MADISRKTGWLLVIGVASLVALTGCAAPRPIAAMAAPTSMRTGVIVSSRQVMLQIGGAEGGVLGALGAPASAGETLAPATEFIVRQANGRVISVMQPQPTDLHPGEAVEIIRGVTTRLAPLPAGMSPVG